MPSPTVIILVSGRSALARVGGVPSVARHVAATERLGGRALVVYPEQMRALGAEIAGRIGSRAPCVAADQVGEETTAGAETVLVIAADWYLSLRCVSDFMKNAQTPAVARVSEHGMVSVPMAKIEPSVLKQLVGQLGTRPAGMLIEKAAGRAAAVFGLDARDQNRLSDNFSTENAEDKMFGPLLGPSRGLDLGRIKRVVVVPVVRLLARSFIRPAHLSTVKIAVGLLAAWMLTGNSYGSGVAGACVLLAARMLDGAAFGVARATLRDTVGREKLDFVGDVAILVAAVCALAARDSSDVATGSLALITIVGVLIGAGVIYSQVLRDVWLARSRGELAPMPSASFTPRLAHRDGSAYGLLVAALLGRLDLFLWAAALASHLFYVSWLVSRYRSTTHPAAYGPPQYGSGV